MAKSEVEKGRSNERMQLQKRMFEVARAKKELESLQKNHNEKVKHHRGLSGQLSSLRDERFGLRKAVADRLSSALHPGIRVLMTQSGDRKAYRDLLASALKKSGMQVRPLIEKIVQHLSPEELSLIIQRGEAERLAERAGFDLTRAKRFIEILGRTEVLPRIQTVELEDLPRIELLDGQDYKESGSLSTGQRCTTILPILLLESERPLLIDQPEDNLDNRFIFETVVKSIKGAKGKRQLIFVTHNPNIPVLGDADRVFVLSSDGRQSSVTHAGSVDDLKEQIETILEGGQEAFLLRKERYGH